MTKDNTNTEHLGDGLYVHFNGYAYELSVNDHRNPTVATFETEHINNFQRFKERMEETYKKDE